MKRLTQGATLVKRLTHLLMVKRITNAKLVKRLTQALMVKHPYIRWKVNWLTQIIQTQPWMLMSLKQIQILPKRLQKRLTQLWM